MSGTELNLQHPTKEEPWQSTNTPARQHSPFARASRTASPGRRRGRQSSRATCFVSFGTSSIRRIGVVLVPREYLHVGQQTCIRRSRGLVEGRWVGQLTAAMGKVLVIVPAWRLER